MSLYEHKRAHHRNIHPFPSSVDVRHFAKAREPQGDPDDQASIPSRRIGFFGVIDERLDVALVDEAAALRPNWHFVFVGPVVKIDPAILPKRHNVHFLGPKSYDELPRYLAGWNVAMLPFARNDATRFISPTKTPEYLAAGKPVVSTSIQDVVRPYAALGLVRIADAAKDFVEAIDLAFRDGSQPAWWKRVDDFPFGAVLGRHLGPDGGPDRCSARVASANSGARARRHLGRVMSARKKDRSAIALWGGPECTVNRVGDRWFDQLERTGHAARLGDLDRIAELGIRTVRYPVLWERVCPEGTPRWSWSDERLERLRELGIVPIVGLLHHGSGPRGTNLLDPEFPTRFAAYARAVATRYPWVRHYTPINEPLTTARFSALYGHWYPHERSDGAFARAIWNQTRATALAMQAIRSVNSSAVLVQTEDLGTISGTEALRPQVAFENERRWLTWDLLLGRVERHHRLWRFLRDCGITEAELELLRNEPCPPGCIGVNHYVTSDRFLDDRLDRHAPEDHGGNGRRRYADVDTVRALGHPAVGLDRLLGDVSARYGLPIAVTEAHLGCTRKSSSDG
jgi:hypothetical protein